VSGTGGPLCEDRSLMLFAAAAIGLAANQVASAADFARRVFYPAS